MRTRNDFETKFSNSNLYFHHLLNGKRPCFVMDKMREHLYQCETAKSSTNRHLIVGKNDIHYLIFLTFVSSELENLWKSTCYFAHDESLKNPQLLTLFLHREFFKTSMEYQSLANLDIHPGLIVLSSNLLVLLLHTYCWY